MLSPTSFLILITPRTGKIGIATYVKQAFMQIEIVVTIYFLVTQDKLYYVLINKF